MATLAAMPKERSASIGTILSRAFGVMGDNPITVFGISCLFGAVPPLLFNYFARTAMMSTVTVGGGTAVNTAFVAIGFGSGVFLLLCNTLAQGAIVRATVAYAQGERASFGECVAIGLRKALPLIAFTLLAIVGLMIGFTLLFVPGVILAMMWAVAGPVIVNEDIGVFGAFGRSRFLTKGARWKVFGLTLLLVVLLWILTGVVGILLVTTGGVPIAGNMAGGPLPLWYMLTSLVTSTFTTALWSTIYTSLYVALRNWKDGPQVDALADVFA